MTNSKRMNSVTDSTVSFNMYKVQVASAHKTFTSVNNSNSRKKIKYFEIFSHLNAVCAKMKTKHSLQNTFHVTDERCCWWFSWKSVCSLNPWIERRLQENNNWFHESMWANRANKWPLAMLTLYLKFKQLFPTEPLMKLVSYNINHFSSWIIKRFMNLYFHLLCHYFTLRKVECVFVCGQNGLIAWSQFTMRICLNAFDLPWHFNRIIS